MKLEKRNIQDLGLFKNGSGDNPIHNRSSSGSLNKYGRSPYLQKISQGFSLPKKNNNMHHNLKQKQQSNATKIPSPYTNKKDASDRERQTGNYHSRGKSNLGLYRDNGKAVPKFKLPKIDMEIFKTDKKDKSSTNSLSATLDATNKKKKLLPIQNTFRRISISKTKAGTNGKQTKINQDIAIIQSSLPHGVKLYCVCDGHGLNGHVVSAFIKQHLIKNLISPLKKFNKQSQKKIQDIFEEALARTNDALLNSDINTQLSGSTVIAVFIYQQTIYSFNIGDSRAILVSQIQNQWKCIPLSEDQKPQRQDQKQRILKFGGRIQAQKNQKGQDLGPLRVWMKDIQMPGLAMTRSFGDKAGRKAGTNGQPQLLTHKITNADKYIVLASDGVWEYLENQQVMNIINPFFKKNDLELAAQKVVRIASEIWQKLSYSRDDITLIITTLHQIDTQSQNNSGIRQFTS